MTIMYISLIPARTSLKAVVLLIAVDSRIRFSIRATRRRRNKATSRRWRNQANKNQGGRHDEYPDGRTLKDTSFVGLGLAGAAAPRRRSRRKASTSRLAGRLQGGALAGKTVAYVPVAMNFRSHRRLVCPASRTSLEPYGVKVIVRDPNWSTNAGAQAVTTLISEKPAAMIIHNPDVQTYANAGCSAPRAKASMLIQINMGSNCSSAWPARRQSGSRLASAGHRRAGW